MGHSKQIIAESVLYKLAGGIPTPSFPIHSRDVWDALESKINALFKLKHFDTTLANGETIPEAAMIATYENVAVTSSGDRSKSTLPITPISLPKNVGIYQIYNPAYPDKPFIPMQRGMKFLLDADSLLNNLFGSIYYEPKNTEITYSIDLTKFDVSVVAMELCVLDVSDYSVTDPLPIPADMINQIEDELIKEFAPVIAKTGYVSNWTNPSQQPQKQ